MADGPEEDRSSYPAGLVPRESTNTPWDSEARTTVFAQVDTGVPEVRQNLFRAQVKVSQKEDVSRSERRSQKQIHYFGFTEGHNRLHPSTLRRPFPNSSHHDAKELVGTLRSPVKTSIPRRVYKEKDGLLKIKTCVWSR